MIIPRFAPDITARNHPVTQFCAAAASSLGPQLEIPSICNRPDTSSRNTLGVSSGLAGLHLAIRARASKKATSSSSLRHLHRPAANVLRYNAYNAGSWWMSIPKTSISCPNWVEEAINRRKTHACNFGVQHLADRQKSQMQSISHVPLCLIETLQALCASVAAENWRYRRCRRNCFVSQQQYDRGRRMSRRRIPSSVTRRSAAQPRFEASATGSSTPKFGTLRKPSGAARALGLCGKCAFDSISSPRSRHRAPTTNGLQSSPRLIGPLR